MVKVYSAAFVKVLIARLQAAIPVNTGKLPLDFATTSGQRVLAVFRYHMPKMTVDALKQALLTGTDEGVFFWTGTTLLSVDQRARLLAEARAKAEAAKVVRDDDRLNTRANVSAIAMAKVGGDNDLAQFAAELE